ncbi:hypothetical protein N7463_009684 [Penicillium fimorum]|uniref:Transposase Tc1-like domain-containing protein n=1 Tax=Penicillium fimorum TaxID=1882269 RepID=A0A9X0C0H8_9EURO|nr:hypothetical protein N7463_009684 [Penicillium fimorum]
MVARSKDLTPAIRERICELHSIGWGRASDEKACRNHDLEGQKKLTEADKDRLLNAIHGDPKITAEDMLTEVNHKVKYRSIQRLLNAENMRKWRCSWRPFLKEEHALKRLQWAHRYRHFTPNDWARVFWSDECTVERGIGVRREWTFIRPKDQPREGQCQGLPHRGKQVKQMFWAAFSGAIRRTGLIPLFGDPNAERTGIYELRPDLLHMGNNDTTKEILVATAQQAWDELELRHLKHLSETMPHRVEAIIESQGWYTPY